MNNTGLMSRPLNFSHTRNFFFVTKSSHVFAVAICTSTVHLTFVSRHLDRWYSKHSLHTSTRRRYSRRGTTMFGLVTFCLAVLTPVSAYILSSPGLRRYSPDQDCVFEWRISRPVASFNFLNQSSSLNLYRVVIHNETSAIHLVIQAVQLYDAGNYTLVVNFVGDSSPTSDNKACLFVHGVIGPIVLTLTEGLSKINEGGALTFVCSGTTTSQPAQFRQDLIYSFCTSAIQGYNSFVRRNDGSVAAGDRFQRIDNQTLRIYPVSLDDNFRWVECRVCDSFGYRCSTNTSSSIFVDSTRKDKPALESVYPQSRKSNAVSGEPVTFIISYYAFPAVEYSSASGVAWSFSTSESGPFSPSPWIPIHTDAGSTSALLTFTFSSSSQYGFYMCNISNILGTISTTFQLSMPGPPDRPLLAQLFMTQTSISLQWNSGWDNNRQQYFRIQLNNRQQNTTIQQIDRLQIYFNYTNGPYSSSQHRFYYPIYHYYYYSIYVHYTYYFNCTHVVNFTADVYPDTDYEVLLWSVNALGSSDVVQLPASTPPRSKIKLVDSEDSISISGNSSVINFSIDGGAASYLNIECYELNSMEFAESSFDLTTATRQVNMTVPVGTKYRFNFRLFKNSDVLDYQTIQIPTEAQTSSTSSIADNTAVIVLAVLLGMAIIFGVAMLVWNFHLRRQASTDKNDSSKSQLEQVSNVTGSKLPNRGENDYTEQSFYTPLDESTENNSEQELVIRRY